MRRWVEMAFHRVIKPLHLRLRELFSLAVDRYLRVSTTDEAVAAAVGIDIDYFRRTQRSLGWTGVLRIIRRVKPGPGDVWLDIGCGAGRVLCGVARRPLHRVIGIDLDPRMADLAQSNATSLRGRRSKIDIECADATTTPIPDDVTLVFLYNPFGGETLQAALDLIIESLDRSPRTLRVIYANPKEPDRIVGTNRFHRSDRFLLGWRPTEQWRQSQTVHIYDSVAGD